MKTQATPPLSYQVREVLLFFDFLSSSKCKEPVRMKKDQPLKEPSKMPSMMEGIKLDYMAGSVMLFLTELSNIRVSMAATSLRFMLDCGLKVPAPSEPVRMPAR